MFLKRLRIKSNTIIIINMQSKFFKKVKLYRMEF